jgi:hypothetical protein
MKAQEEVLKGEWRIIEFYNSMQKKRGLTYVKPPRLPLYDPL